MSLVDDIRASVNPILAIRDEIGAVKDYVYILTRVWPGEKGIGDSEDTFHKIVPTPNLEDIENFRVREAGNNDQADRLIKGISRHSYQREDLDGTVPDENTERWYWIDGDLYEPVQVIKKYVTWNVKIKKTSKNKVTKPEDV